MADGKIRGALRRYQVMAIVTGSFLLLLTAATIIKYGASVSNDTALSFISGIGITHGFIYMVYLVTCGDLWTRVKWPWRRLASLVLGGVVPGLSFVVERRVTRELNSAGGE